MTGCYDSLYQYGLAMWDSIWINAHLATMRAGRYGVIRRAALARQHVYGVLRLRASDAVVILRHGEGRRWMAALFHLRQRWKQLIQATFAPQDAGLLLSLLLGQRIALDERRGLQERGVAVGVFLA